MKRKKPSLNEIYSRSGAEGSDDTTVQPTARKNPIESVITGLPLLMVVAGVLFYFYFEKKQSAGELLMEQSQAYSGIYNNISEQSKSVNAQRILWFRSSDQQLHGARLTHAQAQSLSTLQEGAVIDVIVAPRVSGSTRKWLVRLSSEGQLYGEVRQQSPLNTTASDTQ